MVDLAKLKVGDKVCYQPAHFGPARWENGIVKEIPEWSTTSVRVVYNCAGDWNNFKDYTSALTEVNDLSLGWKSEETEQCEHYFLPTGKYRPENEMECQHCGKIIE